MEKSVIYKDSANKIVVTMTPEATAHPCSYVACGPLDCTLCPLEQYDHDWWTESRTRNFLKKYMKEGSKSAM